MGVVSAVLASMRPRVFPAEDLRQSLPARRLSNASMRPRVFPAEDVTIAGDAYSVWICFNEAAGIPRGRPGSGVAAAGLPLMLQ